MRNMKITRLLCFALAMLFLVSTAVIAVSASSGSNDGVTDKSINDYADRVGTISYKDYMAKYGEYFSNPTTGFQPVRFDATSNWVFRSKGSKDLTVTDALGEVHNLKSSTWNMVVRIENGTWSLTVNSLSLDIRGETVETPIVTYDTMEKAIAAKVAVKEDLVFVTEFDGKKAIYTPGVGSVAWTLNLAENGIAAGVYAIGLEYYPVLTLDGEEIAKSAAIEREFYINGETPYSEARARNISKLWASYQADGKSALVARYVPKKNENVADVVNEATAAGLIAVASPNNEYAIIQQPTVITKAINEVIAKYELRFMVNDADNNEIRPTMVQSPAWTSETFSDNEGYYAGDLGFVLIPDENGNVELSLKGVNESMALSEIVIKPYEKLQDYATYLQYLTQSVGYVEGTDVVKIEAEYPTISSTNVVYPIEDRTSPVTSPADPSRNMLNTIGSEKWATAGQWVEYSFSVDGSGFYDIYSRYKQSYLDGMYVSRSLSVYTNYASADEYRAAVGNTYGYYNGIPFAEAGELRYDYGSGWQVTNMNNGADANGDGVRDTYQMYFEKGVVYTIRFEVTLGSMAEMVDRIERVLTSLNDDYLGILKLTGTSPDDYRDYSFSRLIPDTLVDMMEQSFELQEISTFLKENAQVASTYTGTCDRLQLLLTKLALDENEIAKNLDNLKGYVGNLGTFLSDAKTQPLQLDYISIQPASVEPPKANANFFQSFWHECKSFIQSFLRDYNSMGSMENADSEAEVIDVWFAYGRDQAQVIRNLTTNEFTPDTGIPVNLKLISGGTLLPSILAGMGPDVYLGMADETVINYAIRGALSNIEDMEGFNEITEECFTRAAMLQLEIVDADAVVHTYGLPETQTFQMMFVRMDILSELQIEIPKTWEELFVAQSKLESNNMEIGVGQNYKIFLYQANGDLYADNGMRINLDSVEGLAAFEKMCSMFTQYSFPYAFDAANRFRTGEMPIILSDYTGLYNKLKVFATELEGTWTFVPVPGTVQEDGSINNTADSTITAVVMIGGTEQKEDAWTFMKWYTGAEAQTRYANEMVAIIGNSAKQPTANRQALASMPWTREEYIEVEKQFENLAAIPNYPGSYYLGRHTEFAFLAAYNEDADPTTELLSYINAINNEITRKREEFNLETLRIGQTLASKRMDQALTAIDLLREKDTSGKYTAAINAALYAIANSKIVQTDEASLMFSAFLEYDYIVDLNAIENDDTLGDVMKTAKSKEIVEKTKAYSYFINVSKQTAEKKNGGYEIDSLTEIQLVYFIAECLRNTADALASYQKANV